MPEFIAYIKKIKIWECGFVLFILVTFGTVLAWSKSGNFDVINYLSYLFMIASLLLIENFLYFEKIISQIKIKNNIVKLMVVALFVLALLFICLLIIKAGYRMVCFGLLAMIAAYNYRMGVKYRYNSYGVILITMIICPLCVAGAYYVQMKEISILPFFAALPLSFMISSIIHGEDLKNYQTDKENGIRTLAVFMGDLDKKWAIYAQIENYIDTYLILAFLIIFKILPISAILPIALALPFYDIIKEIKGALSERRECFIKMPVSAYRFYSQFGILLILGIIFDQILCR